MLHKYRQGIHRWGWKGVNESRPVSLQRGRQRKLSWPWQSVCCGRSLTHPDIVGNVGRYHGETDLRLFHRRGTFRLQRELSPIPSSLGRHDTVDHIRGGLTPSRRVPGVMENPWVMAFTLPSLEYRRRWSTSGTLCENTSGSIRLSVLDYVRLHVWIGVLHSRDTLRGDGVAMESSMEV